MVYKEKNMGKIKDVSLAAFFVVLALSAIWWSLDNYFELQKYKTELVRYQCQYDYDIDIKFTPKEDNKRKYEECLSLPPGRHVHGFLSVDGE
jgi:hypothetical protein